MTRRPEPWEVAARLEDAAKAVQAASKALDAAYSIALCYRTDIAGEVAAITGIEFVDHGMTNALQVISDRCQAIADAEPLQIGAPA